MTVPEIIVSKIIVLIISGMRPILAGEVVPASAQQSSTMGDNEEVYGAANAIDLDMSTRSCTKSSNPVWLKLIFDQVQCVKEVVWYKGNPL